MSDNDEIRSLGVINNDHSRLPRFRSILHADTIWPKRVRHVGFFRVTSLFIISRLRISFNVYHNSLQLLVKHPTYDRFDRINWNINVAYRSKKQ